MNYEKRIEWDALPHTDQVGHGREGLVLRLDEKRCIKIYSPERMRRAEKEFENYGTLRKAGFLVPQEHEFVEVHIGGKPVELPGKDEFTGIGLYTFNDIDSVPGIVKEFFPGMPYGRKKPTIKEIKGLITYLRELDAAGLTFEDGISLDFIASTKGTALVDCSTLMHRSQYRKGNFISFEYWSSAYQRRILSDFRHELHHNGFLTAGFDFRFMMANWLSKK